MIKTSESHPLQIQSVRPHNVDGEIGLTLCPGKVQKNGLSGPWQRDLTTDLAAICNWGATVLISLIEDHEFETYKVTRMREAIPGGIVHHVLPIVDGGVPDAGWEKAWSVAGPQVRQRLRVGEKVVIHCLGGLGRTGLVAARLLVEFGEKPDAAISRIRAARPGTIENQRQENYVRAQMPLVAEIMASSGSYEPGQPGAAGVRAIVPEQSTQRGSEQQSTVHSRFLGCLLGGAVGDALGAPVEFMRRDEIRRRFGKAGICDYAQAYGRIGAVTDDTQMTLFTAEGLLRAWVRGCFKGISTYAGVTAHAYLRWLRTQGVTNLHDLEFGQEEPGWLIQQRELHNRRSPGNTCLAALRSMISLGERARNGSRGCGGVMRAAPAGLFASRLDHQDNLHEAFRLGTELAALTHGHPTGALTGGVLSMLVAALSHGAALPDALTSAKCYLRLEPRHEETLVAIEHAEQLAVSNTAPEIAIALLGEGWVAEEALAISIYCALVAPDFRHGVILAVNHDGDSDSTGAITGNLLGARDGLDAIPPEWLEQLELRPVIAELAGDLFDFPDWQIGEHSSNREANERVWRKYPGF
ncbi:ADP-ribosylglycohydrolase family protein [Paraburkholderia sediminicola]|uniref:ADP-ribosylglycohydrolase family protein n=1 Tax=Paraburkholderia sediminicola TaxID=458836 RepID=UPI0038BA08C1